MNPAAAQIRQLLGTGLQMQQSGNLAQAEQVFRQVLQQAPNSADAHYHLGNLRWQLGDLETANACYRNAIRHAPGFAAAWVNLGASSWVLGRYDDAVESYRRVVKLDPGEVNGLLNLAGAYSEQGKIGLAGKYYRQALGKGGLDGVKIRLASLMPTIAESARDIAEVRERLAADWTRLLGEDLHVANPLQEIGATNFLMAYHGEDDRALQMKFTALCAKACPSLEYTARHCRGTYSRPTGRKIRVGFISAFFRKHSIGNSSGGLIKHLSRKDLELTVIFPGPPADEVAREIQQNADKTAVLPADLAAARQVVESLELDILFYQDTGMDAFTYFLSFARLAPVQCTSFGHPVTTGIPALDYYISTAMWEPEDGDSHYSEKLVRLEQVPSVAYYYKPALPEKPKMRADFGLSESATLYVCPQTLFKFHPGFDAAIAGILRQDPNGEVILVQGKHAHWTELLERRLKRTIADVVDRVRFLPQMPELDFTNMIAVCDVMLDTFHFCGFNTTLQAFVSGVPVVTLPGKFMRSRHTAAFYRTMGIADCIAGNEQDYVEIALRLGKDQSFRSAVSRQILDKSGLLWEDKRVLSEFEKVFRQMVDSL